MRRHSIGVITRSRAAIPEEPVLIHEEESNMLVAVRVRPLSTVEKEKDYKSCCTVLNGKVVAIKKEGDSVGYLRSQMSSINDYAFDSVFDEHCTQKQVYDGTARRFIPNVIKGLNVTVFAYGATGAGKTHTMLGNTRADEAAASAEAGIIPQSVFDLFAQIDAKMASSSLPAGCSETYSVVTSFVEIYNEQVYDLLEKSGKILQLREDSEKGVVVCAGCTEVPTTCAKEVMALLAQGNKNRKTEATMANAVSSRSHAVLQLQVKHFERSETGREICTESKLSLIDLAGSERASATNNRGARLTEGANINRSLLALANCINALASNSSTGKKTNVKYRDSRLTHLLKSSLEGGNCNLVMIANVNPAHVTYEDSHNTLKYANRAKNIKVNPTASAVAVESTWLEREKHLIEENALLRERVAELEEMVLQLRGDPYKTTSAVAPAADSSEDPFDMMVVNEIEPFIGSALVKEDANDVCMDSDAAAPNEDLAASVAAPLPDEASLLQIDDSILLNQTKGEDEETAFATESVPITETAASIAVEPVAAVESHEGVPVKPSRSRSLSAESEIALLNPFMAVLSSGAKPKATLKRIADEVPPVIPNSVLQSTKSAIGIFAPSSRSGASHAEGELDTVPSGLVQNKRRRTLSVTATTAAAPFVAADQKELEAPAPMNVSSKKTGNVLATRSTKASRKSNVGLTDPVELRNAATTRSAPKEPLPQTQKSNQSANALPEPSHPIDKENSDPQLAFKAFVQDTKEKPIFKPPASSIVGRRKSLESSLASVSAMLDSLSNTAIGKRKGLGTIPTIQIVANNASMAETENGDEQTIALAQSVVQVQKPFVACDTIEVVPVGEGSNVWIDI